MGTRVILTEPKTETFYVRVTPDVKEVLVEKARREGYSNLTQWFDKFIRKQLRISKKRRTKAKQ